MMTCKIYLVPPSLLYSSIHKQDPHEFRTLCKLMWIEQLQWMESNTRITAWGGHRGSKAVGPLLSAQHKYLWQRIPPWVHLSRTEWFHPAVRRNRLSKYSLYYLEGIVLRLCQVEWYRSFMVRKHAKRRGRKQDCLGLELYVSVR